jgi:hypothetical protein
MKNRIWPLLFAASVFGVAAPAFTQTIFTPYAFSTFAGQAGGSGNADGPATGARFSNPMGLALDSATNIYIADEFNDTIRKMTRVGTNWVVTTLAGSARLYGPTDGTNSFGRFSQPTGVATDSAGNIYVADNSNYTLRKVTPNGVVTTLAGLAGTPGSKDGSNSVARFNRPSGVAVDATGTKIYVADSGNTTIRQIVPIGTNWVVTTIAGTAGQTGNYDGTNGTIRFGNTVLGPQSLVLDNAGNLIVADTWNSTIRKLTQVGTNWIASTLAGTGGIGTADGTNTTAGFYNPSGVVMDLAGTIYVNDGNWRVRKITPVGTNWVTTTMVDGAFGSSDGLGSAAQFGALAGIVVDGGGNLYVADSINNTIRLITPVGTNGLVTTIAGMASHYGTNDGVGTAASFHSPFGVVTDTSSNLYIGDQSANLIRKITPDGTVTTLVGDSFGGSSDGTNTHAELRQPSCLALDGAGNIYFADAGSYRVRRVSPDATGTNWVVTTLAGGGGAGGPGFKDGTNKVAQFSFFFGLCVDAATNIYVADNDNNVIRKVSPQGTNWVVTTIAGTSGAFGGNDGTNKNAQFYNPYAIAVDSATNLYVTDRNNQTIREISPVGTNWVTKTIAGLAGFYGSVDGSNSLARFLYPQGITIDPAGNLYVSDGGNCAVRRLSKQGTNWVVTTLGGAARQDIGGVGQAGSTPGIGGAARFNNIYGLAIGPDGNLYIPDAGENAIVKGSPLFLFDTSAPGYAASSNSMQLRVTGPPGSNVVVQISKDLANWIPVATNVIPPIGANVSIPATNGTGLFRAILMP